MGRQVARRELESIRYELSCQPEVICNGYPDLEYFKPGYSGLDVGSPPLLEVEPPVPARVAEAELEERIASLEKAVRIACEPPEPARVRWKPVQEDQDPNLRHPRFAWNQEPYNSIPI